MSSALSKLVSAVASAAAGMLLLSTASVATPIDDHHVKITFLQLNDVYQTSPVDRGAYGGLPRVSTLKKRIMADNPDAMFVLAGDTLSPSVASQLFKGQQMIAAWNALKLDYATFGNHEFDFGPFEFMKRIADSKFGWICANVIDKNTGGTFGGVKPYVIRDIDGVKVGIFGLLTPDTLKASRPGPRVDIEDPVKCALKIIPQMKAEGAQIIVGLTHMTMEQDLNLAGSTPVDLILGGHEHVLLSGFAGHAPVFKMTSDARFLGKIEIHYNTSTKAIENILCEPMVVGHELKDDLQIVDAIKKYDDQLLKELDQPVGETKVELNAIQSDNETRETNLADFIADAFRGSTGADVVIINGGCVRSNQMYPPGPLKKREVLGILPFENPIVKIEVTGATIKEALEHGVSKTNEPTGDGRFPQVSGLTYKYDSTKPVGSRIVECLVAGKPLDHSKHYTLATNDYVSHGGDGYTMFKGRKYLIKPEEGHAESVILMEALAKGGAAPKVDGRIQRADVPTRSEGATD